MSATEGTLEADDLKDLPFEQLLTRISAESLIQEAPIFQLPDPILVNILSLVKHEDILISVRLVCRKWLVIGRDRYIWKYGCDFFDISPENAISIEKFVACCRYAKGVRQLTFPKFQHKFRSDTRVERENLIVKHLQHMPELKRCVTPTFYEQFFLKSFCDALGRYCPLLTSLHIRISNLHRPKLKLTSHSSCFNMLKRCEHLTALTISSGICDFDGCVTPSFVPVLADCIPNLEELFLDSPNVFHDGCFEALANSSLHLKKLQFIYRYPAVNDVGCIPKLNSLKSLCLNFAWVGYGDPGSHKLIANFLKVITEDGGLCDLTDLSVEGGIFNPEDYTVFDGSLYLLVKNLKKLTVMTLEWLHITDVSLHNIAAHCTKLETLSLRACICVTDSGILTLIEKLKTLKKVMLCCTGSNDIVKIIHTTYPDIDVFEFRMKNGFRLKIQSPDYSELFKSFDSDD